LDPQIASLSNLHLYARRFGAIKAANFDEGREWRIEFQNSQMALDYFVDLQEENYPVSLTTVCTERSVAESCIANLSTGGQTNPERG
jgi:hypothetical protein